MVRRAAASKLGVSGDIIVEKGLVWKREEEGRVKI